MRKLTSQQKAERRYISTEQGKKARLRAVSKSHGKRFITQFATKDELEEYLALIEERFSSLDLE